MNTNEARENFVAWLNDAHAMENQADKMFKTTASYFAEQYKDIKLQLEAYSAGAQENERLLQACLDRYGRGSSFVKDIVGKAMGLAQGFSGFFVSDEVVKALIACYTFCHMGLASYKCLVEGALVLADEEARSICMRLLSQKVVETEWLEKQLAQYAGFFNKINGVNFLSELKGKHYWHTRASSALLLRVQGVLLLVRG